MTEQVVAVSLFFLAMHTGITLVVWVSMDAPYNRHNWSFGKAFWWPLVVVKSVFKGLYEVLFTEWK